MPFDPDEYLKQKSESKSDFDPDAYLKAKTSPKKEDDPSITGSAGRKFIQGATANFSDEIMGLGEAAGRVVGIEGAGSRPVSEISFAKPTISLEELSKAYHAARDHERQALKTDSEVNPKASFVSEIGGGLASPINKLTKGMGALGMGATYGGIAGAGGSEKDSIGGMAQDAVTGAGEGAILGQALDKGGKLVMSAARPIAEKIAPKLKQLGETQAFKSAGAMLKDFRSAQDRGTISKSGRYILDDLGLKVGDTVDSIAERAGAAREKAGTDLDSVYSQAAEKFKNVTDKVGFDPMRDKDKILAAAKSELGNTVGAEAALNKLSGYIDEVAARHGDTPNAQAQAKFKQAMSDYLPKLKNWQANASRYEQNLGSAGSHEVQQALPGLTDDLQRGAKINQRVEVVGQDASRASIPEAPQPQTQMDLAQLSSPDQAVSRVYGLPGEATFNGVNEAANARVGSRVRQAVTEGTHEQELARHFDRQMAQNAEQSSFDGLENAPREYRNAMVDGVAQGEGQLEMPVFAEKPVAPSAPSDVRNPMTPRQANDIKSALDTEINYARNPLNKQPAIEKAFVGARRSLSNQVDQALESLGGDDLLGQLKDANSRYGTAKQIEQMATDKVARNSANQALSLTDHLVGNSAATLGAGAALFTHNPALAIAGLAGSGASKLARKYGTATIAVAADRASKFLMRSPQMAKLASENPKAFQATVISLMDRLEQSGALQKAAANQPNELDTDSSRSSNYKEEPQAPTPSPTPAPEPKRGTEKWATDGADAVAKLDPSIPVEQLMRDPKARNLLISASSMRPDSKAMLDVLAKLKRYGAN